MRVSRRHPILAAAAVAILVTACRGDATAELPEPDTTADIARVVGAGLGPAGGDPESVVVAALIITTGGDLEAAVADGVITPDDVEAARAGLADGSLDALFD